MPLSADSFRTDGASGASEDAAFGAAAGVGAAAGAAAAGALAGAAAGFATASRAVIDLPEQRPDGDGFAVLGR